MTWPCKLECGRIDLDATKRVEAADAERQTETAKEILRRLASQPGLVLADEVGMGKTFVALAVAASAAWADKGRYPVVVMVPPSLKKKWPRDFAVFKESCLLREEDRGERGLSCGEADDGVGFFKLLDDPVSRRRQIIFVTHGALHRGLTDPWTKLAILQAGLHHRSLAEQRRVFHRFAAGILRTKAIDLGEDGYRELLAAHPEHWRDVCQRHGVTLDDDPVPKAIYRVLDRQKVELGDLRQALKELPLRSSGNIEGRLKASRDALRQVLGKLWMEALKEAPFRSPLLILDEAHHLKNPETKLASLFVESDAQEEANLLQGALQSRFERMLFLTATPFQLGHGELLGVLSRFKGIRWDPGSPTMPAEKFDRSLEELEKRLDDSQIAALGLDKAWRRVRPEHVEGFDDGEALDAWWQGLVQAADTDEGPLVDVVRQYRNVAEAMEKASARLRPWVVRHLRSRRLPNCEELRRNTHPGAAILGADGDASTGLPVDGRALLPFLLVARSQAIIAGLPSARLRCKVGGMTFVEGLASSFEAYRETRQQAAERGGTPVADEVRSAGAEEEVPERLKRYLDRLDRSLPEVADLHPKIRATVLRVRELWTQGEKVLVFCHFRATVRALSHHISKAIREELFDRAARQLGCPPAEVEGHLTRIGSAFDPGRGAYTALETHLGRLLDPVDKLDESDKALIRDIIRRFIRTESFLVRYFPLSEGPYADRLVTALGTTDGSGMTLEDRIARFIGFMASRKEEERKPYLEALAAIRTGVRGEKHGEEKGIDGESDVELPLVRVANGATAQVTRQRLMLAFNAPFFPEILIASSVLAEGVDLHLDCRHVIHHDLDWNPSTLEQRTGRVDRIGAKAEKAGRPIQVYLPYVEGTQDEKMYRVVRDRERWFQVVMGEEYRLDELHTDRLAARVPLPEAAARQLAFRLEVWPTEGQVQRPDAAEEDFRRHRSRKDVAVRPEPNGTPDSQACHEERRALPEVCEVGPPGASDPRGRRE